MKKIIPIILLALIIPQFALAAWWNPFSWKIFQKEPRKVETVQLLPPTATVDTSMVVDQSAEIEKLRKEVEILKSQTPKTNSVVKKTPTTPVPPPTYIAGCTSSSGFSLTTGLSCASASTPAKPVFVEKCRPETFVITKLSRIIDGSMRGYFENVITSNAKITQLEAIRQALIQYHNDFLDNPDPFNAYRDSNGERIAYSFDQLEAIDASYKPLSDQYIGYLRNWISVTEKIMDDKRDNTCIDGQNLSYYGVSGQFLNSPLPSPKRIQAIDVYQYTPHQTQTPIVNCSNYQTEKTNLDQYYSNSGTLFSGARVSAENALKAKYPGCF